MSGANGRLRLALPNKGRLAEPSVDLLRSAGLEFELSERRLSASVANADQELLFDRFFRSSEATERAIPGTGLGLTIAKAIVERHEGSIEVESSEGRGTTMRVRLPVREAAVEVAA